MYANINSIAFKVGSSSKETMVLHWWGVLQDTCNLVKLSTGLII